MESQCGHFRAAVINMARADDEARERRGGHDVPLSPFQHRREEFFDKDEMGSNVYFEESISLSRICSEERAVRR